MATETTKRRIITFRMSEDEYRTLTEFRQAHGMTSTAMAMRTALRQSIQDSFGKSIVARIHQALGLLEQLEGKTGLLTQDALAGEQKRDAR